MERESAATDNSMINPTIELDCTDAMVMEYFFYLQDICEYLVHGRLLP